MGLIDSAETDLSQDTAQIMGSRPRLPVFLMATGDACHQEKEEKDSNSQIDTNVDPEATQCNQKFTRANSDNFDFTSEISFITE